MIQDAEPYSESYLTQTIQINAADTKFAGGNGY